MSAIVLRGKLVTQWVRNENLSTTVLGKKITTKRADQYGGLNRVFGTVHLGSAPAVNRRVLLLDPRDLYVIAETVTNELGSYQFTHLAPRTYLVVSQDLQTHYYPDVGRVEAAS
jgi:hypothetical protein